jgi:hypothetical protein
MTSQTTAASPSFSLNTINTKMTDAMDGDDCNEWQVISVAQGQANVTKKQAPATDFTWDDGAILSCFQMAVTSHSSARQQGSLQQEWKASNKNTDDSKPEEYKPQPLSLPRWAVDPLILHQSDDDQKGKSNFRG